MPSLGKMKSYKQDQRQYISMDLRLEKYMQKPWYAFSSYIIFANWFSLSA